MTNRIRALCAHSVRLAALLALLSTGACRSEAQSNVEAFAEGRLTIRPQEADTTQDFSGFELLLVTQTEGDVDTLGIATTGPDGTFSMNVRAREPGIYPLIISRAGTRLAVEEFAVADGDSTTVSGSFPLDGRRLRIVSHENAAWTAYRNAKFAHNQSLLGLVQSGDAGVGNMEQIVQRTSSVLWSLRSTFPGAMASQLAAAESIVMLEGWSDSIVLARLGELDPEHAGIADAVRAARRSAARLAGLDSSVSLIRTYERRLTDPLEKAELQAELVLAYRDSSMNDEALAEALELRRRYPDSEWSAWASRAIYELENLLPGMAAPAFSVVTHDGETLSLEDFRGRFLILEFFEPTNDLFLKEYDRRNTLYSNMDGRVFRVLSISLEADSVINAALFEEGDPPGSFAFATGGRESDVAGLYNVQVIPTRYLIDPDGLIVSKYPGSGMIPLAEDLGEIYAQITGEAPEPENRP